MYIYLLIVFQIMAGVNVYWSSHFPLDFSLNLDILFVCLTSGS